MEEEHFGTIGLKIGDKIYGPREDTQFGMNYSLSLAVRGNENLTPRGQNWRRLTTPQECLAMAQCGDGVHLNRLVKRNLITHGLNGRIELRTRWFY
jgi:hypothetical protein